MLVCNIQSPDSKSTLIFANLNGTSIRESSDNLKISPNEIFPEKDVLTCPIKKIGNIKINIFLISFAPMQLSTNP